MVRLIKYLAGAAVLTIIILMVLPQLFSSTYVKDRIAKQLADITGRDVTINGESSIALRPYLSVSYHNVQLADESSENKTPIVAIDSLRAKLDVMSALWGDARLAKIELIRPQFNLRIDPDGTRNWVNQKDAIAKQLSKSPDKEPDPLSLGTVNIVDGLVQLENKQTETTDEITGLNGQLVWPDIGSPASTQFEAIWRGVSFKLAATMETPFEALKSGKTEVSLSIESTPVEGVFTGNLDLNEQVANGALTLSSQSPKRLSEWLQHPVSAAALLGSVSITGDASLTNMSLDVQKSEIKLQDQIGVGRLQISLADEGLPSVNGTLAFDTLNFPQLSNFATTPETTSGGVIDPSLLDGYGLDLRISANEITNGPFSLNNLAASIIVREASATVDIGQADAFGGTMSGSFELTASSKQAELSANFQFSDAELQQLSELYAANTVSLNGKGNASFNIKSTTQDNHSIIRRLNGEGTVRSKNGSIEGVNFADFFKAATDQPEKIWANLEGSTPYEELNLNFFIANGVSFLNGSTLKSDSLELTLGGRADLVRGSLALRGIVQEAPLEDPEAPRRSLPFFIGGIASSPLIVPLSDRNPAKTPE